MQVQSIVQPAQDSSAAECFRLILSGSGVSINRLLRKMQAPLLLLWGECHCDVVLCPVSVTNSCHNSSQLANCHNRRAGDLDPWIGPRSADRVMEVSQQIAAMSCQQASYAALHNSIRVSHDF